MQHLTHLLRLDLVRSPEAAQHEAVQHLTTFVVAAVSTVLITRVFLALSG